MNIKAVEAWFIKLSPSVRITLLAELTNLHHAQLTVESNIDLIAHGKEVSVSK